MAKAEQILIVEPSNELKFTGPFTSVVSSELLLKNPNSKPVLFKVKTTAPKRYCVRPNCGFIEPNHQVTVLVMLQPFEYDPAEKNTHKFMIQSMFAPPGTTESNDIIWKEAPAGQIIDNKLKCVFIPMFESTIDEPLLQVSQAASQTAPPSVISSTVEDTRQVPKANEVRAESINNLGWQQDRAPEEVGHQNVNRQQLQIELEKLKVENVKLRTEGMRLRNISNNPGGQSQVLGPNQRLDTKVNFASQMPPIWQLIVALIVGMIIAKFFL
ncbi:hypothetical protein HELRODRAFT_184905 [Helobdella robusta]|uniref:MSP domain-containing protein n=1 Tax=Helobdella robusta TaxID=6412 RepID=T1FM56_HELRO|nr:hypothetical protein HELRODRAFT_184905 [Helobdella robusta]ESO05945.1 hypothetical protein HELRODRAFT_184905 [Helobdella robusta]